MDLSCLATSYPRGGGGRRYSWLPRFQSQLQFRRFRRWKNCCGYGCPGSSPSSSSGGSDGGKIAAASGGGDTESPAGARESIRARGVGKLAQIVPLGTADIWTTDLAGRDPSGGIGMASYVFHAESLVIVRLVAPLWMNHSRLCCRGGGLKRHRVVSL